MSYHATITLRIPDLPSAMSTREVEDYMEELKRNLKREAELWLTRKFASPPPTLSIQGIVILKDFS